MNITKYTHALLDINDNDSRLIVDPGGWSELPDDLSNIAAVVVTHVHQDHLDESKVEEIAKENPDLAIFCTQQVADKLGKDYKITVPEVGKQYKAGPFELEFFGGDHARIRDDWPQDQNFGVLVNDALYYPGDSFTPCPKPHTVLAAPSAAPWMKISEGVDFVKQDSAKQVFPTHNNILNDNGNNLSNMLLSAAAEESGKAYTYLKPGESLEV